MNSTDLQKGTLCAAQTKCYVLSKNGNACKVFPFHGHESFQGYEKKEKNMKEKHHNGMHDSVVFMTMFGYILHVMV